MRASVATCTAANVDVGGVDALNMVSGSGGTEGCASKVRTGIVVQTVAAGDQRTPAHLFQWGHTEDIVRARAVI